MPQYLNIPEDFFTEAVNGIAEIRSINDPQINRAHIEEQLRSYVYLGQHKSIEDWTYLLSEQAKDAIVNAVRSRIQSTYSIALDSSWLYTNFNIMETLAGNGQLKPNIARPRSAQEAFESNLVDAHKNDPSFWDKFRTGITDFFNVVKSAIEAALKGLGLNIPFEVIISIAALVALYFFSRSTRLA